MSNFDSHDNTTKHYNTQRLLYKYLYALIGLSVALTSCLFVITYAYIQVSKINTKNTVILQEYLSKGRIATLDKIDQRYASYCYSTQLANFIKDVFANKPYNSEHRYRLLFLLRKGQGSLVEAYQTLSIQEKKIASELIYSKAIEDEANQALADTISRELSFNPRLILSEIGNEKAHEYDWSQL